MTKIGCEKRNDVWWDGYGDGNTNKTPRQVPEFQEAYDDGFYVGQQDYFASRK